MSFLRPVLRSPAAFASATARAAELVAEGLRTKEVAKRLAAEFRIPRNDAYNLAMQAAR